MNQKLELELQTIIDERLQAYLDDSTTENFEAYLRAEMALDSLNSGLEDPETEDDYFCTCDECNCHGDIRMHR